MTDSLIYKDHLTDGEARMYSELYLGISSLKKEVRIKKAPFSRIGEVMSMLKLDHPEIFYLSSYSFLSYPDSENVILVPKYSFSDAKTEEMRGQLSARLKRILAPCDGLDPVKSVSYVRKWIFSNVTYEKLERNYSHEVYGVLFHGIGVCEGIAKTVKLMLGMLGVGSMVVIGRENSENVRHAWNIIDIHGKPRHFDLTYDLGRLAKGYKPIYFSMTDEQIYKDHNLSVYGIPKCK